MLAKIQKLVQLVQKKQYLRGLTKGVAAGIEHTYLTHLVDKLHTIIDVGANKGQFSLFARVSFPGSIIFAFEPLKEPRAKYSQVFHLDDLTTLYPFAIGPNNQTTDINVSRHNDSSSILPISDLQTKIFPRTEKVGIEEIEVRTLCEVLALADIKRPSLLKLDVQGFELEALKGCESLIENIDYLYLEVSFVELYTGQALAGELVSYLHNLSYRLVSVGNVKNSNSGAAIQADFLFSKAC
jgi:FkbM family methyltransferase